jgi:hypothetical protein
VASEKKQIAIAADDVLRVFGDECIEQLAKIGHLPADADRYRFAAGVREAARIYACDAGRVTPGTVRDEIAVLYKASERRQYDRVASLLGGLSPQARAYLTMRLDLPGPRRAELKLPPIEALRDPAKRAEACEMIKRLCHIGGQFVEGRKRSTGKRSITWQPTLFAPVPNKHPPKHETERRLVMHIRSAWLEAVGEPPTATVNPSRPDRPFANLVRECLKLVGANADAVALINELHRRRSSERQRLAGLRRRQRRESNEARKT